MVIVYGDIVGLVTANLAHRLIQREALIGHFVEEECGSHWFCFIAECLCRIVLRRG
jgi:hypothetical protein